MNADVIEKIKKLLALATSSNEHEARLAAEKASELLLRHNLKMQDLGEERSYDAEECFEGGRLRDHTRYVISILKKHFFCDVVSSRSCSVKRGPYRVQVSWRTTLNLVGEETNMRVGRYVYGFLDRVFPELWRKFHAVNKRSRSRNYYAGLHYGINEQLYGCRRRVENDTGLVVASDPNLPAAVARLLGPTRERGRNGKKGRISRAFVAGYVDGKQLKIRSALESNREPQSATLSIDGRGQG